MADLKDIYNNDFIDSLADALERADLSFNRKAFLNCVYQEEWESLALKQRVRQLSTAMYKGINKPFPKALPVLLDAAPSFKQLEGLVFPDYVEQYGLAFWEKSMDALARLTVYSTSEFAVRPFLLQDQERMLSQMMKWTKSSNEHIRRLASEGARPRLPWAHSIPAFKQDPAPLFVLLEPLMQDDSLYVRKSVANHLNDISKTHPDLVIEFIRRRYGQQHPYTDWILRHAARTLLKQGNKDVLHLFGYPGSEHVSVQRLTLEKRTVVIGEALHFSVELHAALDTKVRVEYAIDYMKKNGRPSRKVFQLSDTHLAAGQSKVIVRTQSFRDMTTRKHYAGEHTLVILVNGVSKESIAFQVTK
ncbi:DNA alkylation repair protein [Domibacillus sp. PGB-M46]|uniref:DNA alkylation repair protein n=1 Tax=Domibacillus sp. PGB-M46 TaxID=2910255 RepID=UPI001F5990E8|nr:DNA alkylation repair protein [Domibacillus sp. PGB-M46]MCI2253619.1 DNA alkylation repair protein [Domibacillus sp. PGB-M46]